MIIEDEVEDVRTHADAGLDAPIDDGDVKEIRRVIEPHVQLQLVDISPYDVTTIGRQGGLVNKFLEILEDGDCQVVRLTFL